MESLLFSLGGSTHDPHLDLDIIGEVSEYLDFLKEKYHFRQPAPKLDDRLGPAYLPGPVKDFIREELKRRDARDRQQVAFKEAQQVWGDLGYPALKGRILEIVGLQAVENIVTGGRYEKVIPAMQDLLKGKFGRLGAPVQAELHWRVLSEETPREEPAAEGELLSLPGLEEEEDVLTYSLFPEEAETFFLQRAQGIPAAAPAPSPRVPPGAQPFFATLPQPYLTLNYKGEEVRARLEGVGFLRKDKQVLFINIQDHIEEIEVQLLPGV